MKKLLQISLITIILALGIFAWSPWITQELAEQRTEQTLQETWLDVADGCGIDCSGCGAVRSRRAPFGVIVTLEYGCGMIPADTPEYHERATVFVSSFGVLYGLPRP